MITALGTYITRSQFFGQSESTVLCAHGHAPEALGLTRCGVCGTRFEFRSGPQWVPTLRTQALAQAAGLPPEQWWRDLWERPASPEKLSVFRIGYAREYDAGVLGLDLSDHQVGGANVAFLRLDLVTLDQCHRQLVSKLAIYGLAEARVFLWSSGND